MIPSAKLRVNVVNRETVFSERDDKKTCSREETDGETEEPRIKATGLIL